MWYGHLPEPFERKTRVAFIVLFFASLFVIPFFPPILVLTIFTGRMLLGELSILAHPCCPSSYDEVGVEANKVFKGFIIASGIVVFLLVITMCVL